MTPSDPGTPARCPQPAARLPRIKRRHSSAPGAQGKRNSNREGDGSPFEHQLPGRQRARPAAHSEKVLDPGPAPPQPQLSPRRPAVPKSRQPRPQAPGLPGRCRRCAPGLQASRVRNRARAWAGLGLRAPPRRAVPVGRGLGGPPGGAGVRPGPSRVCPEAPTNYY